jgi:hypothetical protein
MLKLDQDLPETVLLGSGRSGFAETLQETDALWFNNEQGAFEVDQDTAAIRRWHSAGNTHIATPAQPNEGNGLLSQAVAGLQCIPEVNCGLVVPEITQSAGTFTMAVVYKPSEDYSARTLLTVNTSYSGGKDHEPNYLFLSDGGDFFTVKDVRGCVDLTAPVTSSPNGMRMAIVTVSGDTLAVAENRDPPVIAQGTDTGMKTTADLFIGCRSHRSGLKKTLGGAVISEVMFWPKHALLLPRTQADTDAYVALKRYFLWEY